MFTNSLSLEKEVERFRRERIDSFRMQEDTEDYKYSKFMMLHIIPETFLDSNYKIGCNFWNSVFNISNYFKMYES